MRNEQHLLLKWGTLKAWNVVGNERAMEALRRYHDEPVALGVMSQRDSNTQKAALCDLIDAVDGEIHNDWSGEIMTKDEAKKYVLEYGQPASPTPSIDMSKQGANPRNNHEETSK